MKKASVLFLSVVLMACMTLLCAPVAAAIEYDLYFKAESFTWKEFNKGTQLLEESGPIFGVGASAQLENKSLTFKVEGEFFGGRVDYDGQTQSGTPVETDVDYVGAKIEGDLGWKFVIADSVSVGPFAGAGFRYWVRDIKSTDTATGYEEKWSTVYGRLGMQGGYRLSDDVDIFAGGGAKFPVENRNKVDYYDVTLEPGRKTSYFAEAGIKWRMVRVLFYYEGLRFSESDAEPIGGGRAVFQPESQADMYGINAGWSF